VLTESLLGSYVDSTGSQELEEYETAKTIAVPLLKNASGDQAALEASIAHAHYSGIVEICHATENHARLQTLLQQGTSTRFPRFVLRWHADRNLYASVLNLGRYCQEDLRHVLKEDPRLAQFAWMNDVREKRYADARTSLTRNVGDPGQCLQDARLFLSLGKLVSSLVDDTATRKRKSQDTAIEDGLVLVRAQEMLGVPDGPKMTHADLFDLSLDQLGQEDRDGEDRIQAGLCGLALAEVLHRPEDMKGCVESAGRVWARSVVAEIEYWKGLAARKDLLSQELLEKKIKQSIFARLVQVYVQNRSNHEEGKCEDDTVDLGILHNEEVANFVLAQRQLDDDTKTLLKIAARLAAEAE